MRESHDETRGADPIGNFYRGDSQEQVRMTCYLLVFNI
jgi:hypothetical protein